MVSNLMAAVYSVKLSAAHATTHTLLSFSNKVTPTAVRSTVMGAECCKDIDYTPAKGSSDWSITARKVDDDDAISLPAAIQVKYSALPIYADASLTSDRLCGEHGKLLAKLGSFWEPIAKAQVRVPGKSASVMAYEIELIESRQRGWLIDYHEGQSSVVDGVTRKEMQTMPLRQRGELDTTLNRKIVQKRKKHGGQYYTGAPRTDDQGRVEMPHHIRVKLGAKDLALRESPVYGDGERKMSCRGGWGMMSSLVAESGDEFVPLAHREFVWSGGALKGAQNRSINFYKVRVRDPDNDQVEGWLLDYTPNGGNVLKDGTNMLEIKYRVS